MKLTATILLILYSYMSFAQFEQGYNIAKQNDLLFVNNGKSLIWKLHPVNDIKAHMATLTGVTPTTTATGASGLGANAFYGGVLLLDGRVLLVPLSKGQCYVYDPVAQTTTATGASGLGANAFYGGVLLLDGRVLLVPYSKGQCYVYDPVAQTTTATGASGLGTSTFFSVAWHPAHL